MIYHFGKSQQYLKSHKTIANLNQAGHSSPVSSQINSHEF